GVARLTLGEGGSVLSEGVLTEGLIADNFRPVAVSRATGAVYVGSGPEIKEFSSAGVLQLAFGSEDVANGSLGKGRAGVEGIGVNDESGRVYVVNPAHEDIDVFGAVIAPAVIEGAQPPVSAVSRTSVLVGGRANPESGRASCYFQYVPAG